MTGQHLTDKMELDTFISKIDLLINRLQAEAPAIADEVALKAIAMVKNRIVDQRQGIPGKEYSTKPMLATEDQFIVKSAFKQSKVEETRLHRSSKGVARANRKGDLKKIVKRPLWIKFPKASKAVPVMLLEDGYKEFREIQGRQGDVVDLSLTGKMWQGTTIIGRVQKHLTFITVIGGTNIEAQQKLSWMVKKYGNFLVVMEDEQQELSQIAENRLQKLYDSVMLTA